MDDQSIQNEVILGVDTHLDVNVGAVISHTGKLLGTLATTTDACGYLQLLAWARSLAAFNVPAWKVPGLTAQALLAFYAGKELKCWK